MVFMSPDRGYVAGGGGGVGCLAIKIDWSKKLRHHSLLRCPRDLEGCMGTTYEVAMIWGES